MTADRSNLVPEARTDKNGVTSVRWVKSDNRTALGTNPLPAPALNKALSPEDEQQRLYIEILAALDQSGSTNDQWVSKENLELWRHRTGDQTGLFRTLLTNVDSNETFKFIEQVHGILDYYGADDIPSLINDESLESVVTIIESTEHLLSGDGMILPEETRDMIHYALTSPDRELITQIIMDRHPDTVAQAEGLVAEARRSKRVLQSGVL